ncbi:MAG: OmpA family protein [Deferribacteraceae bacterium]|nr:OmpA family protein [Deferribacteraceae bacterium]
MEAKNNVSRVSTVIHVFARDAEEARAQVELNGWQVGLVKQLTFRHGDSYIVHIDNEPPRAVPMEKVNEAGGLSDEELILSILGPPKEDAPLPLPAEEGADDKLTYIMTIYFSFGGLQPQIDELEQNKLASLEPSSYYYLFGHTDNVNINPLTTVYTDNFDLSFKRAEAVKKILTNEYNIAPENISTVGFGSTQPAAENRRSKSGTLENRRVEIFSKRNP